MVRSKSVGESVAERKGERWKVTHETAIGGNDVFETLVAWFRVMLEGQSGADFRMDTESSPRVHNRSVDLDDSND